MTDEQAVRKLLAEEFRYGPNTHVGQLAAQALALLDAKDAELREYKEAHAFIGSDRDAALSRAEQAEAALAEERKKHQAFRVEVSQLASWVKINLTDLILGDVSSISYPTRFSTRTVERLASNCREYLPDLSHFILPAKPAVDPLADALSVLPIKIKPETIEEIRAAIERAGGTISFENSGGRYPAKDRDVLLHDGGRAPGSPHSIERADGRGRA